MTPLLTLPELGGRVVMLNRMRRLLISDWHPIIDVILNDYTREIKRQRPEPPDDDEIDVLDQDMET